MAQTSTHGKKYHHLCAYSVIIHKRWVTLLLAVSHLSNEKRYNFLHDSILLNIVRCIQDIQRQNMYADIAGFKNPTFLSAEDDRPDIIRDSNQLYVLELTVGYETNMSKNSRHDTRT